MSAMTAIIISSLALLVSAGTAYLTFLRRGRLRATLPTVVYFGPDGPKEAGLSKVYLRTLLYSTSRRGQVVESMHVSVSRGETRQNFSIWVLGDERLSRGSGLFVGEQGIATNHHFLLPADGTAFPFSAGHYDLRLFAKRVGDRRSRELLCLHLTVTDAHAGALLREDCGLYFDWGPDQEAYHAHVRGDRPRLELPKGLLEEASRITTG
ncbi:MAG: hypothetical protein ACKVUT_16095 [Gaiella sp.]